MRRGRPPYPDLLTPREQAVLSLLREGLTNEQIASRPGISESGARYHVSEILSKLGVNSRQEAAVWQDEAQARRLRGWLAPLLNLKRFLLVPARVTAMGVLGALAAGLMILALGGAVMSSRSAGEPFSSSSGVRETPAPSAPELVSWLEEAREAALTQPPGLVLRWTADGPMVLERGAAVLDKEPELTLIQIGYSVERGVHMFRFTEVEPAHWFTVEGPHADPSSRWLVTRAEIPRDNTPTLSYVRLDLENLRLSPGLVIQAVQSWHTDVVVEAVFLGPASEPALKVEEWEVFGRGPRGTARCVLTDSSDVSMAGVVHCSHSGGATPSIDLRIGP